MKIDRVGLLQLVPHGNGGRSWMPADPAQSEMWLAGFWAAGGKLGDFVSGYNYDAMTHTPIQVRQDADLEGGLWFYLPPDGQVV